ncbi:hypothetical protein MMC25_007847 [Agyrium rufum]|nr:hypothetical protein [Agyrium rufum]
MNDRNAIGDSDFDEDAFISANTPYSLFFQNEEKDKDDTFELPDDLLQESSAGLEFDTFDVLGRDKVFSLNQSDASRPEPGCLAFLPSQCHSRSSPTSSRSLNITTTDSSVSARTHHMSSTPQWEKSPISQRSTEGGCSCLQNAVLILEALEDHAIRVDQQAMDTSLAYHKQVIDQVRFLTHCLRCTTRSDYILMLVILCDKIAGLYERVITNLRQATRLQTRHGKQKDDDLERKILFGDYAVDSVTEWIQIIKSIVGVHLRKLSDQLEYIKALSTKESRESRLLMLRTAEQTVARLEEEINKIGSRRDKGTKVMEAHNEE